MIRPFQLSDANSVVHIIKEVYDDYGFGWEEDGYHADLYDIAHTYLRNGGGFWVAEVNGQVVGCGGLKLFDTVPGTVGDIVEFNNKKRVAGADCELVRLYVLKSARGLGLGKGLTRTIIEAAKQSDRKVLELWSDKLFQEAHQLYQSFGCEIVGERICDDPDEAPEWGLMLRLKKEETPASG